MVICGAPDYLRRAGEPRTPEELAGHNCLNFAGSRRGRDWPLKRGGVERRVRVAGNFASNNGVAIVTAAARNGGIMIVPFFLARQHIAAGRLVPVLEEWQAPEIAVRAIYPDNRQIAAKVRTFVNFLVTRYGSHPDWDATPPARGGDKLG